MSTTVTVTLAGKISGVISNRHSIAGTIYLPTNVIQEYARLPEYDGITDVIPHAYDDQVLLTKDYIVRDDITVFKIPTSETSNEVGTTFVIAS